MKKQAITMHEIPQAASPVQVRYTYYTAGSGGVGPTIMETSMLLAGTDVVVFKDNERVSRCCWGAATLPACARSLTSSACP